MHQKICAAVIFIFGGFVGGAAYASSPYEYEGRFAEARLSDPACASIFEAEQYFTRLFLMSDSSRTVVLHFTAKDGRPGFLDGMSLVGVRGWDDVAFEKSFVREGQNYTLVAEGMADAGVIVVDVKISKLNTDQDVICETSAEYTGFRP